VEITSLDFALLAIVAVFFYYIIPLKFRIGYLVLTSCGFIATYDIYLPLYLSFYAYINFILGQKIQKSRYGRALFRIGIFVNITQLVLLRYASFTIEPILSQFNSGFRVSVLPDIILPLGISYYTLQGIGYLINVKMKWEKPEMHFLRFFLYLIFFPKFLSGPIERSNHFLPQLAHNNEFNPSDLSEGFRIALQGFFKKIVIANHLGASVTQIYSGANDLTGFQIGLLILIQPLYLYFDFAGYTDIAVGFARAFGIKLIPNFNKPFLAENMTNFWRRFHISLSSWFNDYVFKQTSFRMRKLKENATAIAVFITWILFGIWHGAGWNFMVLGLLQALAIYYEYRTKKIRNMLFSNIPVSIRPWIGRFFTYIFYAISLTFFFAPDLPAALGVFKEIATPAGAGTTNILNEPLIFGMSFVILFLLFEILQNDLEALYFKIHSFWVSNRFIRIITYYSAISLILTQINGNSSFIYEMF
jgi:alginate O-acetyltransferase complex protein AlgI